MSTKKSSAFYFLKRQQEIQEWIEKVTNKRFQHHDDFGKSLADGILLCKLMLSLEERSIPKFNEKPTNKYQQKENVFLFIEACRDYGVPKERLFIESDLIEQKNLVKVVECLEILEDLATQRGCPIQMENIPDDHVEYPQEQVQAVESMLQKLKIGKGPTSKKDATVVAQKLKLQIASRGGNADRVEKAIIRMQAHVRGRKARREFQKRQRAQAFRDSVAKEILNTEETYLSNLKVLMEHFKKPLMEAASSKKEIIPLDQIKMIFSDVEVILGYNSALLEEIKPRVQSWSPSTCLGDIFLKICKFMKVYTNYVKGYDDAINTLNECKKKPKFEKFLQSREELDLPPSAANIEMLLILPIQRIPRYNLLLEQLLKHTWESHRDYAHLQEAYKTMKDVAKYVNEKKREFENIQKVREIQNAFVGKADSLISPNRKFVRSDVVAVWSGTNDTDKKQQELVLTMFNDLIVVAQHSGKRGTLKFKEAIRISNVNIKEAKLRRWAQMRGSMSGTGNMRDSLLATPQRRDSVDSRRGSFIALTSPYSVKNTVELVNSREETILKVCFENPMAYASWCANFKSIKDELNQMEEKKLERAKKLSEATKLSITSNLTKSMEARRSSWRTASQSKSFTQEERDKIGQELTAHEKSGAEGSPRPK